uniref:Uncharacterized protein n=1 Tax=Nomascus leucogenys TaxID=61853 RepID=G1RV76_NOMLE
MNINPCLVLCEHSLSISLDADPPVSSSATGPCPGAPREVVVMQSDVGQGRPMWSNCRAPVHVCTSGAVRKGGPVSWEQRQKEVEAAQGSEDRGPGSLAVGPGSLAVSLLSLAVLMVLK